MKFFRKPFQKGMPISTPGFAEAVAGMARAWETLSGSGCRIWWDQGRPKIIVNNESSAARLEMFRVFRSGDTSVKVRAGAASRWDGGAATGVSVDMTTDATTSHDPADTEELTGITTSQWIQIAVDDPLAPTTLTATATGDDLTIPTSDDGTVIPVALVIVDGGKITRIFQAHSGPWYLPSPVNPDGLSLNRTAAGKLQWRGYDSAADDPDSFSATTSLFGYKPFVGALAYITLKAALGKMATGDWTSLTILFDAIAAEIAKLKHSELKDIVDGLAGDDHGGTGNFAYVANSGDYGRNAMANGLGDAGGNESVRVELRQLVDRTQSGITVDWDTGELSIAGSAVTVDWLQGLLNNNDADIALNWFLRELSGDWSAKSTLQVDGKLTAKDDAAVEQALAVTLRTTTNDLTVTQAAVTVGGNIYTPRRAADLSPDALVLAYDP